MAKQIIITIKTKDEKLCFTYKFLHHVHVGYSALHTLIKNNFTIQIFSIAFLQNKKKFV